MGWGTPKVRLLARSPEVLRAIYENRSVWLPQSPVLACGAAQRSSQIVWNFDGYGLIATSERGGVAESERVAL